jgi:hypothetical protein
MSVLFWLIVGHFVADFPLQTEWIAKYKNRHNASPAPPGQKQVPVWPWIMSAHAATHAGAVALATGSPLLGCAEFVAHWGIDWAKCEGHTGPNEDQILHLACKLVWFAVATAATVRP